MSTIAILGTGNVAKGLGQALSKAGQTVIYGSRNQNQSEITNTEVKTYEEAVQNAEVIVLAVPYHTTSEFLRNLKQSLAGKVVIDVTNPLKPDISGLSTSNDTSAAEEIQKLLPESKVVKAFNTIFASAYAGNSQVKGNSISTFIVGNDAESREMVSTLAKSVGLDAVDCGDLSSSRYLEALAYLNIKLAFMLNYGPEIGFKLLR